MRVDNGIKIFNYIGELVYAESIPELYKVGWRPSALGEYATLPIVYKPITTNTNTNTSTPNTDTTKPTTPLPVGTYRHPNFAKSQAVVGGTPKKRHDDTLVGGMLVGGQKKKKTCQ